jgi:rare lipoprotein A
MFELNMTSGIQKKFTLLIALLFIAGCATASSVKQLPSSSAKKRGTQKPYKIDGKWYTPIESSYGFEEMGIASWYGKDFHGKKTSNGETYDMHAKTAAHKTLPMNTYVKVTSLDNGRETIVRINDRGPFVSGRIIDLSYSAAKKIGIDLTGTARVKIEALGSKKGDKLVKRDYDRGSFNIQVGAFTVKANADRLRSSLESRYGSAYLTTFSKDGKLFYRVRIGNITSLLGARDILRRLATEGFGTAFVVAD